MVKILPFHALFPNEEQSNLEEQSQPNRFNNLQYDRSVFEREECTIKTGSCKCLECSETPFVIVNAGSLCKQNNIRLRNVREYIDAGLLLPTKDSKVFFIYQQTKNGHTQTGISASLSVDDCISGLIKRHEQTTKPPSENNAHPGSNNIDPLMIMYHQNNDIDKIIKRIVDEEVPFHDDETELNKISFQKLWCVSDEKEIESLQDAFSTIDSMYIADGHHRAAAACKLLNNNREQALKNGTIPQIRHDNYIMAILFPHDQLNLIPFNRLVTTLSDYSVQEFLDKVSNFFYIKEINSDGGLLQRIALDHYSDDTSSESGSLSSNLEEDHIIKMYIDKRWFEIEPIDPLPSFLEDSLNSLDSQILYDRLLKPILQIECPRTDTRLIHISGESEEGLMKRVDNNEVKIAFSIKAVTISEVMGVANSGHLLPPKATCFDPKPEENILVRLH